MPSDGIRKGGKGEGSPQTDEDDPVKQGGRQAFHGLSYRCCPMTHQDGEVLFITCALGGRGGGTIAPTVVCWAGYPA